MNKKLDNMLQEYLVHDAKSMREYKALSEDLRVNLSRKMIEAAFSVCAKKAEGLDYSMFEKSRGNIDRVEGISDLIESIAALKNISSNGAPIEGLVTVESALKNLRDLRTDFENGFRREDGIVKFTYVNACVALYASVSYLIACYVDYVKDGPATMQMVMNKNKALDSCMLKGLEQFNKMCLSGELQRIFASSMKAPVLAQESISAGAIMAAAAPLLSASNPILISTAVITAVFVLISFLRLVVYQYYNMRVKIADYCHMQAQFLEMNATKIGMVKNMKNASRRQESISKTLNKLADKIDVDQKMSTHKAKSDMHMEDRNFSMTQNAYDDNIF